MCVCGNTRVCLSVFPNHLLNLIVPKQKIFHDFCKGNIPALEKVSQREREKGKQVRRMIKKIYSERFIYHTRNERDLVHSPMKLYTQ